MAGFTPSLDPADARRTLAELIQPHLDRDSFARCIDDLQHMYSSCCAYCPYPFAGYGLRATPEISYQCEQWLPLDELRPHFHRFYRRALTYPPVLSSTPFASSASWAGIVARFPPFLRHFDNPAKLFEQLLADAGLRTKFLFWSFMPERFYGSVSDRYPGQSATIAEWIQERRYRGKHMRCLDAASGDGANTYGVARLLVERGWLPDRLDLEGWTLEPLEAWAAAYGRFPHDPARERLFRAGSADCFERGYATAIRFCCVNILDAPEAELFDLILCNGLLGGPLIHDRREMDTAVRNLTGLLAPGGMLLAADHFHGGWKQKCPQDELRAVFEMNGLVTIEAAEGIAALKP